MGFREVYDYVDGKADWFAYAMPREGEAEMAGDVLDDVPTCGPDDAVRQARERMTDSLPFCVILNEEDVILGAVRRQDLDGADDGVRVSDVAHPGPTTFRPSMGVDELHEYMSDHALSIALVSDASGRLLGGVRHETLARRADRAGAAVG